MAEKDAFAALSRRAGGTDRDTAVDVDGGFGTLLSHASRAAWGFLETLARPSYSAPTPPRTPRSSSCSSSSWSPR
jgi:hypothetical protein